MKLTFPTPDFAHIYRRAYRVVNYRLRSFAGGRWSSLCRPTDVGIMLTNLCNARCVHCDIWKNKGREDTPSIEHYRSTLSELRRWLGPVHVFFSGGEALLRPYAMDLIAHASSIGLFAELLTHGYWEDQTRIEKLALANPGRVTVSVDGIGGTHSLIRGHENFFEKTERSLETLQRIRRDKKLGYTIRLKTVIMEQNLHDVHNIAHYAADHGMEVFYQPVEQNYNTPEDDRWFEHSVNWPKDSQQAVQAVEQLVQLKRAGLPIRNSFDQFASMCAYFRNPACLRLSVQMHASHEKTTMCSALTNMQINPNGDVLACYGMPPIGNIQTKSIRKIWTERPAWWRGDCCLQWRLSGSEKMVRGSPRSD